jgi:hypothetical protein
MTVWTRAQLMQITGFNLGRFKSLAQRKQLPWSNVVLSTDPHKAEEIESSWAWHSPRHALQLKLLDRLTPIGDNEAAASAIEEASELLWPQGDKLLSASPAEDLWVCIVLHQPVEGADELEAPRSIAVGLLEVVSGAIAAFNEDEGRIGRVVLLNASDAYRELIGNAPDEMTKHMMALSLEGWEKANSR